MIKFISFLSTNSDYSRVNDSFFDGSYEYLFDEMKIYTENDLDNYIKSVIDNIFEKYDSCSVFPKRGYGYWIWKPYLLMKEFENMNDNDIIVFLDMHCYLENVADKFNEIINKLNNLDKPVLIGWCNYEFNDLTMTSKPLRNYIESQLNYKFTNEELLKPQVEAGIIFLRKNKFTVNLIKQWFNLMLNGMDYVSDMYNDKQYNHPEFSCNNRHDQSVFSLLCKYYKIYPYMPFDWGTFNSYYDGQKQHSVVWGAGHENYNK